MTKKETVVLSWTLGLAAAAMVGLGYAGEIHVPFVFIVAVFLVGLMKATRISWI